MQPTRRTRVAILLAFAIVASPLPSGGTGPAASRTVTTGLSLNRSAFLSLRVDPDQRLQQLWQQGAPGPRIIPRRRRQPDTTVPGDLSG